MDLGRLNRNAKERSDVGAAIASALPGLYMSVQGVLAHLEGQGSAAWIFIVIALLFSGLAVGVYRGSEEAELWVVVTFAVMMFLTVLAAGFRALFPWQLIMAVLLWAGMRGVPVRKARPPAPGARRG